MSVELFFFGIEVIEIKTVLSISEAIISRGESSFKRASRRTERIGAIGVGFDLVLGKAIAIPLAFSGLGNIKRLSRVFRDSYI